jgi:hypothetical protein
VHEAAGTVLTGWEGFYVIIGTSVAALTGLMFVVIALMAEAPMESTSQGLAAFGTPNIVHYSVVILLSGLITAPWSGLTIVGILLTLIGVLGFIYTLIVLQRARRQTGYKPVLEDWVWHTAIPFFAYALLAVAGIMLHLHATSALFLVGAVSLLLVFVGIHNSWDTVTYIALSRIEKDSAQRQP